MSTLRRLERVLGVHRGRVMVPSTSCHASTACHTSTVCFSLCPVHPICRLLVPWFSTWLAPPYPLGLFQAELCPLSSYVGAQTPNTSGCDLEVTGKVGSPRSVPYDQIPRESRAGCRHTQGTSTEDTVGKWEESVCIPRGGPGRSRPPAPGSGLPAPRLGGAHVCGLGRALCDVCYSAELNKAGLDSLPGWSRLLLGCLV